MDQFGDLVECCYTHYGLVHFVLRLFTFYFNLLYKKSVNNAGYKENSDLENGQLCLSWLLFTTRDVLESLTVCLYHQLQPEGCQFQDSVQQDIFSSLSTNTTYNLRKICMPLCNYYSCESCSYSPDIPEIRTAVSHVILSTNISI